MYFFFYNTSQISPNTVKTNYVLGTPFLVAMTALPTAEDSSRLAPPILFCKKVIESTNYVLVMRLMFWSSMKLKSSKISSKERFISIPWMFIMNSALVMSPLWSGSKTLKILALDRS